MLTKLSLWGIYFASYLIDYVIIFAILVYKRVVFCQNNEVAFWDNDNLFVWVILLAFILISLVITVLINGIKMNTRVKLVPGRNVTLEVMGYLLPQVVTVATTVFTDWWIPINVALFVVVGFIFVMSDRVYMSPLFAFPLGNKIFEAGDCVIITRYSEQAMRIAQEDSLDGLEARELTNKVYYVRK